MKEKAKNIFSVFKWGDLIILLILIVSLELAIYYFAKPQEGGTVEIYLDGKLYRSVSLNQDTEIDINGHNKVKIEGGEVYMLYSDCDGGDCLKMGKISKECCMIVCLPNMVVVKIVSGDLDAIT